jgi:hypothetical protein
MRSHVAMSDGTGLIWQSRTSIGTIEQSHPAVFRAAPTRALLAALIAALAVRPLIGNSVDSSATFGVTLVILLVVSLYNINVDELVGERGRLLAQSRRRRILGWALAAAAAAERIAVIFVHSPCSTWRVRFVGCYSLRLSP